MNLEDRRLDPIPPEGSAEREAWLRAQEAPWFRGAFLANFNKNQEEFLKDEAHDIPPLPNSGPETLTRYAGRLGIEKAKGLTADDQAIEAEAARQVEGDLEGMLERYKALEGSEGGKVLSADLALELFPAWAGTRESRALKVAAVAEPARALVKEAFRRALYEKPPGSRFLFLGGGEGSGRIAAAKGVDSTKSRFDEAAVVYDSSMGLDFQNTERRIEEALAHGHPVDLVFVWCPVEKAVRNAVSEAIHGSGKTMPMDDIAQDHFHAPRNFRALADKYAGRKDVTVPVIDSSGEAAKG